ncbi:MAG: hypothetical protein BWK76_28200 [Desulfobulbaceae bacterium A2]|nr:MAG: hypothetical protein BWK76_28200 [Desulfobulbaceae bacterium A2]
MRRHQLPRGAVLALLLLLLPWPLAAGEGGRAAAPQRIVSLVPAVTEMLLALGGGERVVGVTWHDESLPGLPPTTVVGGFAAPSVDRIEALAPDLLITSSLHRHLEERLTGTVKLWWHRPGGMADIFAAITELGQLLGREDAARALVARLSARLERISARTAAIVPERRVRVLRLMGADPVMVPGDDSFQNDFIRAAGGIPPELGRTGQIVPMTLEEWQAFNPQVVYGCGDDVERLRQALDRPGWREVEAVRDNRILTFPCELTCRPSVRAADFTEALAAALYPGELLGLGSEAGPVPLADDVPGARTPLELDLPCLRSASLLDSTWRGFANRTLVLEFNEPQRLLSTLDGPRQGIRVAGNHALSPPTWKLAGNLEGLRRRTAELVGQPREETSFLFTGASMDSLSIQQYSYRDMRVVALVTAGVRGNAMRAGSDEGSFYEPGTINVIVLSNMHLSERAMARAIISATEAKSAALADLDVRSASGPRERQATGTGTDNVLVIGGSGPAIDNSGGHTKMGELVSKAVHDGVIEAVARQSGIRPRRSVLARLDERRVRLGTLATVAEERCGGAGLGPSLENILLTSPYDGLVRTALAAVDAGVYDALLWRGLAHNAALSLAGSGRGNIGQDLRDCVAGDALPPPLALTLNGLVNGILAEQGPVTP